MIALESTVQLNIFNTSIEILQETADVCGLLEGSGFEFVAFEIPSQTVPNSDVDVKNIFNHLLKTDQLNSEERAKIQEARDSLISTIAAFHNRKSLHYGNRELSSNVTNPSFSPTNLHLERYSTSSSSSRTSSNSGSTKCLDHNITIDSLDSDFLNNSVSNGTSMNYPGMSTSMAACINSIDGFFKSQVGPSVGLEQDILDHSVGSVQDIVVSTMNRMVDQVCHTSGGSSTDVCNIPIASVLPEQKCTDIQVDHPATSVLANLQEVPNDDVLECPLSNLDNQSFLTASEMELLKQDLQSWDFSQPVHDQMNDIRCTSFSSCSDQPSTPSFGEENEKHDDGTSNVSHTDFDGDIGGCSFDPDEFSVSSTASDRQVVDRGVITSVTDQRSTSQCNRSTPSCGVQHITMGKSEDQSSIYGDASEVHCGYDSCASHNSSRFSTASREVSPRSDAGGVHVNHRSRRKKRTKNHTRKRVLLPCMFPECKTILTFRNTRRCWSRLLRHARTHATVKIACEHCKVKSSSLLRAQIHHQKKHPRLTLRSVQADEISHEKINLIAEICFPIEFKKMKFTSVCD